MESIKLITVSTVDAIRNALEADILNLRFAPGSKITESDLAVRYNVSRNTVREAIAHLLAQGLLTKIANKGVSVRRFTVDDVQEIFHLRAMLEAEAVCSIISNGVSLDALYPLVEELETLNRLTQWDEYVRADITFHRKLVSAAGSPRLARLYDTILTEVKLCIYQTRHFVAVPTEPNTSHRIILDTIRSGDLNAATQQLHDHIKHVIKRYCAGLIAMDQAREQ